MNHINSLNVFIAGDGVVNVLDDILNPSAVDDLNLSGELEEQTNNVSVSPPVKKGMVFEDTPSLEGRDKKDSCQEMYDYLKIHRYFKSQGT